jgi:flagellar hook-associated protein 3 FlgL
MTGAGTLQQLIEQAAATKSRLDQLTTQASSGYIATTYAGVDAASGGAGATQSSLALGGQIASLTSTVSNINAATGRMGIQQTALANISSVASGVLSALQSVDPINPQSLAVVASSAQLALVQVANMLDTKDGNVYVFGGQNSNEPPIPNPNAINNSGFATQIAATVASLATNGASATSAAALAIGQSNAAGTTPFAAMLGASPALPQVSLGNGATATIGIAANTNGFVTSSGSSNGADTTGSYMRDILTTIASVASLGPVSPNTTSYASFARSTAATLGSAIDTLNQDAGVLGNTQNAMTAQATGLQQTINGMTTQQAGYDQVNMATTLSDLSAVQTQLQASYQLIAAMKTMSLTQYI